MMKMISGVLVLIILWAAIPAANSNAYYHTAAYDTVYVKTGDTVWKIAAQYVTDKDDIRDLVVAIRQVNALNNNARILPGQLIKVPVRR